MTQSQRPSIGYTVLDEPFPQVGCEFSPLERVTSKEATDAVKRQYEAVREAVKLKIAKENAWNQIYSQGGEKVPWHLAEIPTFFTDLVSTIKPCRTLDIGCGLGQYANHASKLGFDVTGIDLSTTALAQATEKYPHLDLQNMNALEIEKLQGEFDLMYDVSLFHHLTPEDKKQYAKVVSQKLSANGSFAVCCFDTEDKYFEGKQKMFSDVSNTTMYPVTESIIRETFEPYFHIESLEKITFGKEYDKKRYLTTMRLK